MKSVIPEVFLIGETGINPEGMIGAMKAMGGNTALNWLAGKLGTQEIDGSIDEEINQGELLIEVAGRSCYKSYGIGLNPNVTKIRTESKDYIDNTLAKADGSIMEHGSVTFAFVNVSRTYTHELVRHRVGVAISQESLRFVRPTDLGLWLPPGTSETVRLGIEKAFKEVETIYKDVEKSVDAFNTTDFDAKKRATSLLRRMLPQGMATNIIWTANHRTLRHVLAQRTAPGAEIEIRIVFDKVGKILKERFPLIYADFTRTELPDGTGSWVPKYVKV